MYNTLSHTHKGHTHSEFYIRRSGVWQNVPLVKTYMRRNVRDKRLHTERRTHAEDVHMEGYIQLEGYIYTEGYTHEENVRAAQRDIHTEGCTHCQHEGHVYDGGDIHLKWHTHGTGVSLVIPITKPQPNWTWPQSNARRFFAYYPISPLF